MIYIILWTLIILIIILMMIIIIIPHQLYEKAEININPKFGPNKQQCYLEPVTCDNDQDCDDQCHYKNEFKCKKIFKPQSTQNIYGNTTGICVPKETPIMDCKNGILTWSANEITNKMEWSCVCPYPTVAGGDNCQLNPDICDGNPDSLEWNINSNVNPFTSNCKCPDGQSQIYKLDSRGPICVPENLKSWYYNTFGSVFYNEDKSIQIFLKPSELFTLTTMYFNIITSTGENNNSIDDLVLFKNDLGVELAIPRGLISFFDFNSLNN